VSLCACSPLPGLEIRSDLHFVKKRSRNENKT
jgi:hypothetical protein